MFQQRHQFRLYSNQVSDVGSSITYLDRSIFTVFPDNNEKIFDNDAIYLMFTSNTSAKIEITAEFPNEEERKRRRRENKEDNDNSKIDK